MSSTSISVRRDKGCEYLSFVTDPAGKPPTLDFTVLDQLETHVRHLRVELESEQTELRAVLLESASSGYFVVGANLNALAEIDETTIRPWVERGHQVFNALSDLPLPVLARVDGYCYGGGFELALSCDLIYAGEKARFAFPEAGLGFVPGWGGLARLAAVVGPGRAKELAFSGRSLDGPEAVRLGVAVFCGTDADVDQAADAFIESLGSKSRISLAMIKHLSAGWGIRERDRIASDEAAASRICLSSGDTRRRLKEFFATRKKKSGR